MNREQKNSSFISASHKQSGETIPVQIVTPHQIKGGWVLEDIKLSHATKGESTSLSPAGIHYLSPTRHKIDTT
jgi:hypothetical protein